MRMIIKMKMKIKIRAPYPLILSPFRAFSISLVKLSNLRLIYLTIISTAFKYSSIPFPILPLYHLRKFKLALSINKFFLSSIKLIKVSLLSPLFCKSIQVWLILSITLVVFSIIVNISLALPEVPPNKKQILALNL